MVAILFTEAFQKLVPDKASNFVTEFNFRKTQVNKTILPPQFQKVRIEASTKVHNIVEYNIVIYPNVRIGLSTKEPPCPVLYSPIQ